jgi:hypothetical protein
LNTTVKKFTAGLAIAILAAHALPALAGGDSSDGHTHAAPTPSPASVAPVSPNAPRMSSQTEQFELVGVLQGQVLTLYLDQFGTNTPIPKAQIELESGAWKGTATEVAPAVYTVAAEALAQPGKHPLAITVQAGDATDLMDATLEVGPVTAPNAVTSHTLLRGNWTAWSGAFALVVVALALVFIRRKRSSS